MFEVLLQVQFESCKSEGIVRHYTVSHNPQQNSLAECMNMAITSRPAACRQM
jgi:hypothetical protein